MPFKKELIVLVGAVGSGKSTYCANSLPDYFRISQDDMGKKGHLLEFQEALGEKDLIVVDRMNFNKEQRARYLVPAKKKGYVTKIIVFDVPFETLLSRLQSRENHPTLPSSSGEVVFRKVLGFYYASFEEPTPDEADVIERNVGHD